jgi:hypothetical protein
MPQLLEVETFWNFVFESKMLLTFFGKHGLNKIAYYAQNSYLVLGRSIKPFTTNKMNCFRVIVEAFLPSHILAL